MDPRHRQLSTSPFIVYSPSRRVADTSHPAIATPSITLNFTAIEPTDAMLSNHLRRRIRLSTPIDHFPPRVLSLLRLSYQLHDRRTRESTCCYLIRTVEGRELTVRTLRGRHNRTLEGRAMGLRTLRGRLWIAVTIDVYTCIFSRFSCPQHLLTFIPLYPFLPLC